jgi:hypothetical protein
MLQFVTSVSVLRQNKQGHCHAKANTALPEYSRQKKKIWTILKKALEISASLSESPLVTFQYLYVECTVHSFSFRDSIFVDHALLSGI